VLGCHSDRQKRKQPDQGESGGEGGVPCRQ
jgi:hypothetical protein